MDDSQYQNETIELLCNRSSCRSWTGEKIPADILHSIVETGIHAATAGNIQPYSILIIKDQITKQIIAGSRKWIAKAPVILVFCIDWHRIKRWAELEMAPFNAPKVAVNFWLSFQDTVICTQTVATAADAMGLGSVYLSAPIPAYAKLRKRCQLPEHVMPLSMLCLGYPRIRPIPKRKLGVELMVHNEKYHEIEDNVLLDAFNEKFQDKGHHRITQERLERVGQVCRKVHGEEFAEKCLERIEMDGFVNHAQYLFGDLYRAHIHAAQNPEYLEYMEACGFVWFKS